MSDHLLLDMADKLFAEAPDWSAVAELGLPDLLVPEAAGGFGGTWQDAHGVMRLAGFHALDLPLAETILAGAILQRPTEGRVALADNCAGAVSGTKFSGRLEAVAGGHQADQVLTQLNGKIILLDGKDIATSEKNILLGEEGATLDFASAPFEEIAWNGDLLQIGAIMRTAQMAGAFDAALQMSVGYANDREQFGRKLGKFQAVQQELAVFALEAAAANCASIAAFRAVAQGDYGFEAANAKLRCNMAAAKATRIAHQVHGAIGFTKEYDLQQFTRRIWGWRSSFGSEAHWADYLGDLLTQVGGDTLWSYMVERDQAASTPAH